MQNKVSGWVLGLDGKYWGLKYSDGHCTEYGWTGDIDQIKIDSHSSEMPKSKTWFTYNGSHYSREMEKGEWYYVEIVRSLNVIK